MVIDAPLVDVWPFIGDSRNLLRWGPPVIDVPIGDEPEGLGSRRAVTAKMGSRTGHFREGRIVHEPRHRVAFVIEADTFGLSRFVRLVRGRPLASIRLVPQSTARLRIRRSFARRAKSIVERRRP